MYSAQYTSFRVHGTVRTVRTLYLFLVSASRFLLLVQMGQLGAALASSSSTAVVVGASRGIGLALATAILNRGNGRVVAASRHASDSAGLLELAHTFPGRLSALTCDVTDVSSLLVMASRIKTEHAEGVDLLLNAAGILHEEEEGIMPERSLSAIDHKRIARVLDVNAIGPVLTVQALQKQLKKGAVIGNLSARVGSIGDNRLGGWWS